MHAFVRIKAYIKELDLLKLEQTPFICGRITLTHCIDSLLFSIFVARTLEEVERFLSCFLVLCLHTQVTGLTDATICEHVAKADLWGLQIDGRLHAARDEHPGIESAQSSGVANLPRRPFTN
jgi:hypothetical protein